MIYYECNTCKKDIESPPNTPTLMIGEWREEKKNNYIFFCNECLMRGSHEQEEESGAKG